jgi:hypothetical protein
VGEQICIGEGGKVRAAYSIDSECRRHLIRQVQGVGQPCGHLQQ